MEKKIRHIIEIERDWLGREIKRTEYDIELSAKSICRHEWEYLSSSEMRRECRLCGEYQEWSGDQIYQFINAPYGCGHWVVVKKLPIPKR